MIKVITCATHSQGIYDAFKESCDLFDVEPVVLGWGHKFGGLGMKLKLVHEYVYKLPEHTDVLFTDCFDAIFVKNLSTIAWRWDSYEAKGVQILMSAERNCFPYHERAGDYPPCPTSYRFLNGGGWIAKAGAMTKLLTDWRVWSLPDGVNDQGTLTDAFLADQECMTLDVQQDIFQCLYKGVEEPAHVRYDDDAVVNIETGTQPCLLHGNGGVDMRPALNWLYQKQRQQASIA